MPTRRLAAALAALALAAACGSSDRAEERAAVDSALARDARARLGEPAPDFTLSDLDGNRVSLAELRGKPVVLEWFNPDCPFVRYAYEDAGLAALAAEQREAGVAWLRINSGAPGRQGAGREHNQRYAQRWDLGGPLLLDEDGTVGRLYGARATPHVFVIDAEGQLAYAGALDNRPLGGGGPREDAVNYVEQSLADLAAEREVEVAETPPYGCSVKYAAPQ